MGFLEGIPLSPRIEIPLIFPDGERNVVPQEWSLGLFFATVVVYPSIIVVQRHAAHQVKVLETVEFRQSGFAGRPAFLEFSFFARPDGESIGGHVTITLQPLVGQQRAGGRRRVYYLRRCFVGRGRQGETVTDAAALNHHWCGGRNKGFDQRRGQ